MQLTSHAGTAEDFLGVGPWLDDQVDSTSFLGDAGLDPSLAAMQKQQPVYASAPMMGHPQGMMMYPNVAEPNAVAYVLFCLWISEEWLCVLFSPLILNFLIIPHFHILCYSYNYGMMPEQQIPLSGGPTSPSTGSHSFHDTSSSSSPASPSSPPPPTSPNSPLTIELLHKPRGSAGQWRSILGKQRVRVTHGRGKNMRMLARSYVEPNWDTFRLILLEKEDAWTEAPADLFSVETKRPIDDQLPDGSTVWILQLDLKLFAIHKVVAFRAEVAPMSSRDSSNGLIAISSVMSTHNSGRRDARGKGDDDDGDEIDEDIDEPPTTKKKKRTTPERVAQQQQAAPTMMPPVIVAPVVQPQEMVQPDYNDYAMPPAKQAKTNSVRISSFAFGLVNGFFCFFFINLLLIDWCRYKLPLLLVLSIRISCPQRLLPVLTRSHKWHNSRNRPCTPRRPSLPRIPPHSPGRPLLAISKSTVLFARGPSCSTRISDSRRILRKSLMPSTSSVRSRVRHTSGRRTLRILPLVNQAVSA